MRCWFTILTLRQNSSPCILVASKKIQGTGVGWQGYDHNFWKLWWWTSWRQIPYHRWLLHYYSNLLQNLTDSNAKKRPEKLLLGVLLHHDNVPPHRVLVTVHSLHEHSFELLPQLHTHLTWHLLTSFCFAKWKGTCVFASLKQMILLLMRWCSVVTHKNFLLHIFWGHSRDAALGEEVLWTCGRPQRKILRFHGDSRNLSQVSSLPITPLSYISERKLTGLGTVSGHLCCQTDILHNSCI